MLRIARRIRVADDPQVPIREVLQRGRDVVEERIRRWLDRCLVAIEVQAIEVEALLRLKRLLHRLAAIAALLLLCCLCPDRHVRDDQQSDAADQPESSQSGSSSECDHYAVLPIDPAAAANARSGTIFRRKSIFTDISQMSVHLHGLLYRHSPTTCGFAASVALFTSFGNIKSSSPRAKGGRGLG